MMRSTACILALAACVGATVVDAQTIVPWEGGATPELRARTIAGRELGLSDYAGRTVLVNFWATWCAPCVAEMPALQRLRDRLGAEHVEVIAVNLQESAARIAPFVERLNLSFPVVRDHDGSLRAAWHVTIFPSTFVVSPNQRIVLVATGEIDWDDPRVESRIRALR